MLLEGTGKQAAESGLRRKSRVWGPDQLVINFPVIPAGILGAVEGGAWQTRVH